MNQLSRTLGMTRHLNFPKPSNNRQPKNRPRNQIWFNPPFNAAVTFNLTIEFYKIIESSFPANHPYLRKLFNKRNLRLSYSTTSNLGSIIARHNAKILRQFNKDPNNRVKPCNCRNKSDCPLNGDCQAESIIYRADVSISNKPDMSRFYLGATAGKFKLRHYNHKKSLAHIKHRGETALSAYVWSIRESIVDADVSIKWSIVRRIPSYQPGSRRCMLCTTEKLLILQHTSDPECLNQRRELFAKCRHRNKCLLKAYFLF